MMSDWEKALHSAQGHPGFRAPGHSGFCAQVHSGFVHRGAQGLVHGCTGVLILDLLDPVVWCGDWLVDSDRLGSRVGIELDGRQVCHQQELLVWTPIAV